MAFDGVTVAAVVKECRDILIGSRIYKIAQPETDELLLTCKAPTGQYRLLLSASASLPLIYLTEHNKPSPMTAPNFCMLLRKHIQNGRIIAITQPGMERIMQIEIEHLNELGDLCRKKLIIEIMGKHSNIIFCDENSQIIDSIKHISGMISSVREVLPGKPYFIAKTEDKLDPVEFMSERMPHSADGGLCQEADPFMVRSSFFRSLDESLCQDAAPTEIGMSPKLSSKEHLQKFNQIVFGKAMPLYKALYSSFTGISPILAQELCYRSNLDADRPAQSFPADNSEGSENGASAARCLSKENISINRLYYEFVSMMEQIQAGVFSPMIVYENGVPKEFAALPLTIYNMGEESSPKNLPSFKSSFPRSFSSISELLEAYYAEKNAYTRIRQKSADLRKIVQTALERTIKKYDLQRQQIKDTEKREKYKLYGELLHTYGYNAEPGAKSLEAENYYTGEMITIPLDPTLTAAENAKKYFERYGKLKRTYETLSELTVEVKIEIEHLESISASLDIAEQESDLVQIKDELAASGYIRKRGTAKKDKVTSKPFHYISSDGFHMYVGKNNYQNDELTFKFAAGNDWWFHAKKIAGSHVIVKTEGKELPDTTFEEAARLAAYYSKGREQEKVEIDYLEKKNVKKPAGAKPGFVVYYTNYSMAIDSDISGIQPVTS